MRTTVCPLHCSSGERGCLPVVRRRQFGERTYRRMSLYLRQEPSLPDLLTATGPFLANAVDAVHIACGCRQHTLEMSPGARSRSTPLGDGDIGTGCVNAAPRDGGEGLDAVLT